MCGSARRDRERERDRKREEVEEEGVNLSMSPVSSKQGQPRHQAALNPLKRSIWRTEVEADTGGGVGASPSARLPDHLRLPVPGKHRMLMRLIFHRTEQHQQAGRRAETNTPQYHRAKPSDPPQIPDTGAKEMDDNMATLNS